MFYVGCRSKFLTATVIFTLLSLIFISNRAEAQNPAANFSATNSSGCAPLAVQFQNLSLNAVSYVWDFGNGNSSSAVNPNYVYQNPGNYTVTLTAYNSTGASNTITLNNFISIQLAPIPEFSVSSIASCLDGNLFSFTNLSANYDSCVWDFGDGTISSDNNPIHTYNAAGIYSVTLIAYNTAFGCAKSKTKNQYITVHPKPTANIAVDTNTTCNYNYPFQFSASSNLATQYVWDFGNGSSSSVQNPIHVFGNAGVYNVTLITTSAFGCKDTLVKNGIVFIKSNPKPDIYATDSAGCQPFRTQFMCNTQALNYHWQFGDGTSSVLQNPYKTYQNSGTYYSKLSVQYNNGCSNSDSISSIDVSLTPQLTYNMTNFSGCSPLTVQFSNATVGPFNYLWDFGDGTTSSAYAPSHTYTIPGDYTINLTAFSGNGCTASYPLAAKVHVEMISANGDADLIEGCPPHLVNFSNSSVGAASVVWNFGNGDTSSLFNPTYTYPISGNFVPFVVAISPVGCRDTFYLPDTIKVSDPINNFSNNGPIFGCAPFQVNSNDNSAGAVTWFWDFGDGTTSNTANPTHIYTGAGTYTVTLQTTAPAGFCEQNITDYATYIIDDGYVGFTYVTSPCEPFTATFTDTSYGAVSWFWDFGDGNTSSLQHPVHIYANPGIYSVSLTITTAGGCSYTATYNYAIVFEPLQAFATANTSGTTLPMTVQFYANSSGATGWLWDFGDGGTSSLANPIHIFTAPGPYTISLTIFNDSCTITYNYPPTTIGVGIGVLGNDSVFVHIPTSVKDCVPFDMHFKNVFTDGVAWQWDFGDGNTSALPNPIHTYMQPGIYTVSLICNRSNGAIDTLIFSDYVIAGGVSADFSITHMNFCMSNVATFTNNSPLASTYLWNFGDGNVSLDPNPIHTFTNPNYNYVVSLTVVDSLGCSDFKSRSYYGSVLHSIKSNKRRVCAGDSISFNSTNLNFASYQWDFGDGSSSNASHPVHVFNDGGQFNVLLTATDTNGCVSVFNLPYKITVFDPQAEFTIKNYKSYCWYPVYVEFENLSSNGDIFMWNFGDGGSSILQNPWHNYVTEGYHDVTLTVIKNNCSSTYTMPNAVFVPKLTVNFSYTQSSECLPITITCSDSSNYAYSWKWNFGDGSTSNQTNPVYTFNTVPTADIVLTVTDTNGCKLKLSQPNIKVMQGGFFATPVAGCLPLDVQFNDTSINAAQSYWMFGDGTNDTLQSPLHSYNTSGFYDVSLIVQAASGCRDTISYDSLIRVSNPLADFMVNDTVQCAPAVVNFTQQSSDAIYYHWDFGDGSISSNENPSHIYSSPGTYTVTLSVYNDLGCGDTITKQSLIRVLGPVSNFSISDSIGCAPFSIQLNDLSSNANTWLWSLGNGDSTTIQNPNYTFQNPGVYDITLITTDTNNCKSVYTHPVPLTIYATPQAIASTNDTLGCLPLASYFVNQSLNFDSLIWNFGDGNSMSSTSASNFNYTYQTPGTFQVQLIAMSGNTCFDTLLLPSPIVVSGNPIADFSVDTSSGCVPLYVSFINTSTYISGATFKWDFGNGQTSDSLNPNTVYTSPGLYTVTLEVWNDSLCYDIISKTAFIKVFDTIPPAEPDVYRVSVLDNEHIDITWQHITAPDLGAYHVYRLDNNTGQFLKIFTLPNPNNTVFNSYASYTDSVPSTLEQSYTYKVQAEDLCQNAIDVQNLRPYTTINLRAIGSDNAVELYWTPYGGCTISGYDIYRNSILDTNFIFLTSVASNQLDYVDSIDCSGYYGYKIIANDLCGFNYNASSDTAMALPINDLDQLVVEVIRSTVVDNKYILTEWNHPSSGQDKILQYDIFRTSDLTLPFSYLSSVSALQNNYIDYDVEVKKEDYYYLIRVLNICDVNGPESNRGKSVLLRISYNNGKQLLEWTPYTEWRPGVEKYVVEQQLSNGQWVPIRVLPGNTLNAEID